MNTKTKTAPKREALVAQKSSGKSIHERVKHLIAPVGGPRDLSTNKKYLGKKG